MAEYIEREAVLRRMQKIATEAWKMRIKANVETVWNEAQDVLRFFPAADVRPVVRGKWIVDGHHIICSACNEYLCIKDEEHNEIPREFCPNCGADMRAKPPKEETE